MGERGDWIFFAFNLYLSFARIYVQSCVLA